MANVLFITGDVGPAEGSIYSNLISHGHNVSTYHTSGRWIPHDKSMPLWMGGYTSRRSPLARNWFRREIASKDIDVCISSGLMASSFAARNYDEHYYPLLWRGSLNFSGRYFTEAFADIIRSSDRLLLEDTWEMDQATAKHSPLPHLRMKYPIPSSRSYLTSDSGDIAIIHSKSAENMARQMLHAGQEMLDPSRRIQNIDIASLYTSRDLAAGRDLYDVLSERLQDFSYAVFVGTGPHHSTVIRALMNDRDRFVVDQTIGMAELSRELQLPHRARGLRCIQLMTEITGLKQTDETSTVSNEQHQTRNDFVAVLEELWQQEYEPWFEQVPALESQEPLNIYFSVGSLEEKVNGARPQRVRNMHDAFTHKQALTVYGSSDQALKRRSRLAKELMKQGRAGGIFYGENHTQPMPMHRSELVADLLDSFAQMGGRSMWFVRDMHWLGAFDEDPWSEQLALELRKNGLHELRQIEDKVDLLAAPSDAAGEGFNQLLEKAGDRGRDWFPLPPAVQPQNIVDDRGHNSLDGVTVLYAGGISSIYSMGIYLSALRNTADTVLIDFVVRKPEEASLREELARLGLLDSDRVRILNTTMNLYRSRTSQTLGAILMESEYAKYSFPYKTMTMIERGYPILCFSDMGIADFVESNKLGIAVERTEASIRDGIEKLIQTGAPGVPGARTAEVWEARVEEISQALASAARNAGRQRRE